MLREEFYKTKLANLKPDEKIDPESFKKELDEVMKEMNLTKTEDVNTVYSTWQFRRSAV